MSEGRKENKETRIRKIYWKKNVEAQEVMSCITPSPGYQHWSSLNRAKEKAKRALPRSPGKKAAVVRNLAEKLGISSSTSVILRYFRHCASVSQDVKK